MEIEKITPTVVNVESPLENVLPDKIVAEPATISAVDEQLKNEYVDDGTQAVPYILNGELYKILKRDGENVIVRCCSCPTGRFYRGSVRSTGNFHMHIKRRHPYLLGKLHDMKVQSLLERRDRLLKNRKSKIRGDNGAQYEGEQHKLKIKRAFQRHQAEAKDNEQDAPTQQIIGSMEKHMLCKSEAIGKDTSNEIAVQLSEATLADVGSLQLAATSTTIATDNKVYCHSTANVSVSPISQALSVASNVTPYPSTYDGSAFGEYIPALQPKNIINHERPLDLSFGARSPNSAASQSYTSSGIFVEPVWSKSNTTISNTISTVPMEGVVSTGNSSRSSDFGPAQLWQQRIAVILRDLGHDIRARNRIEKTRLLLEIEKFKFLHPGFYFNLPPQ